MDGALVNKGNGNAKRGSPVIANVSLLLSTTILTSSCTTRQFIVIVRLSGVNPSLHVIRVVYFALQLGHCIGCCTLDFVHPAETGQPSPAPPRGVFRDPVHRLHELTGDFLAPSAVR